MKVKETVVIIDSIYELPSNLSSYIKYLQNILKGVPEKYKDNVFFEQDVSISYSDPTYKGEISYFREETQEEIKLKTAREQQRIEDKREVDLQEYYKLKLKLGL